MSIEFISFLGVVLIIGGVIFAIIGRNRGGELGRIMYVLGRWGAIAGILCALPMFMGALK